MPSAADWASAAGRVVLGQDVAVDDDGDADSFLDLAHEGPVGGAGVELLTGAAMHGDHADAGLLRDAGETRRVQAGVVPAHAHLQRDRDRDGFDGRLQDRRGGDFVAHQRGPGGLADGDLPDRAAEVDVDQMGAFIDRQTRGFGHRGRVAAGKLDRGNTSVTVDLGHIAGSCGFPGSSPRRRSSPTPPSRRRVVLRCGEMAGRLHPTWVRG